MLGQWRISFVLCYIILIDVMRHHALPGQQIDTWIAIDSSQVLERKEMISVPQPSRETCRSSLTTSHLFATYRCEGFISPRYVPLIRCTKKQPLTRTKSASTLEVEALMALLKSNEEAVYII